MQKSKTSVCRSWDVRFKKPRTILLHLTDLSQGQLTVNNSNVSIQSEIKLLFLEPNALKREWKWKSWFHLRTIFCDKKKTVLSLSHTHTHTHRHLPLPSHTHSFTLSFSNFSVNNFIIPKGSPEFFLFFLGHQS